jgi:tetratricopeptide (TPR) repeat protein
MVYMVRGHYTEALEPFRESVAICLRLGISWQLGTSYLNLGTALLHAGFSDKALEALQEGGRVYRQIGDQVFAARIDNTIAHAALVQGDVAEADRLAREALMTASTQHERQGIADGLYTLAGIAAARSNPERAATLTGAAAAVRETIAARPGPFDLAIPGRLLESAERSTNAGQWHRAWQAGHALQLEAAVARALE